MKLCLTLRDGTFFSSVIFCPDLYQFQLADSCLKTLHQCLTGSVRQVCSDSHRRHLSPSQRCKAPWRRMKNVLSGTIIAHLFSSSAFSFYLPLALIFSHFLSHPLSISVSILCTRACSHCSTHLFRALMPNVAN